MRDIYLDFNASTPVAPEVAEIMRHALETGHGNPSSSHWAGVTARQMIENARARVADLLGCSPQEIVFTSGGSEANNHALKGVFFASGMERPHFITSNAEHPAIAAPLRFLERLGAQVTWLPVDGAGLVDTDDLRRAITPDTVLATICMPTTRRERSSRSPSARRSRESMAFASTPTRRSLSARSRRGWTNLASIC
jgi:cysteine desulfurase